MVSRRIVIVFILVRRRLGRPRFAFFLQVQQDLLDPRLMLDALVDLSRALMREFTIPVERVSTHRVVDEKMTQCPGKHFPRDAYLRRLGETT